MADKCTSIWVVCVFDDLVSLREENRDSSKNSNTSHSSFIIRGWCWEGSTGGPAAVTPPSRLQYIMLFFLVSLSSTLVSRLLRKTHL